MDQIPSEDDIADHVSQTVKEYSDDQKSAVKEGCTDELLRLLQKCEKTEGCTGQPLQLTGAGQRQSDAHLLAATSDTHTHTHTETKSKHIDT